MAQTGMTEKQAMERLLIAIEAMGGQRAFANSHGLSPAYVNDVVKGRRAIAESMCKALGLVRRVTYHIEYTEDRISRNYTQKRITKATS